MKHIQPTTLTTKIMMTMMKTEQQTKILTLGHPGMGTGEMEPFDQIFQQGRLTTVADIKEDKIDALVIWGGADISPSIYNEHASQSCGAGEVLSRRDIIEFNLVKAAIDKNIPIIGICRGAQLLCAMSGGRLIQHVSGHTGGNHSITTNDGRTYMTSSVHHQMMYPFDVEHEMIAWSTDKRSKVYVNQHDENDARMLEPNTIEPEIVYFPKIQGLAIQGHPEFMDERCDFVQYCIELVNKYLLGK